MEPKKAQRAEKSAARSAAPTGSNGLPGRASGPGSGLVSGPKPVSPLRRKRAREAERDAFIHPALRNAAVHAAPAIRVSASALGSIAVLVALISGLGFAGWSVLQDIQRVRIAPIDQTPGAVASVATPVAPALEAAASLPGAGEAPSDLLYARVYRPQELDVPVLDHRDGPIAGIDPEATGHFQNAGVDEAGEIEALVLAAAGDSLAPREPQLLAVDSPPQVSVFATSPAWIRVYLADGSRVFEKILETGEAYVLPPELQAPLLRAGNSGSVFLSVDNVAYGPIGKGTSIAKDVSLVVADVRGGWPISADQSDFGAEAVAAAVAAALPPVAAVLPGDLEAASGELATPGN